jgi:hypothetical protein
MAGIMATGGNTTAGGYPDYTQYCTLVDTNQFEDNLICNSIFEGIGKGGHLNGAKDLGQVVRFWTVGKPNVNAYVKNGGFEYDTLSACPVDYKLDKIRYSAHKFDISDTGACKFPEMRSNWLMEVPRVHAQAFDADILCFLPSMAGACSRGNNAGSTRDIALGTATAPVAVSSASTNLPTAPVGPQNLSGKAVNIFEYMTRGQQAMESFNLPINNNVTALIPNAVRWRMINSELANNAMVSGGSGVGYLGGGPLNGYCGDTIAMRCGFEVRSSNCIKEVGNITVNGNTYKVYRIIWVWAPGLSTVNRAYRSMDNVAINSPMARADIRMSISGAAVSRSEGVDVGYIYFVD